MPTNKKHPPYPPYKKASNLRIDRSWLTGLREMRKFSNADWNAARPDAHSDCEFTHIAYFWTRSYYATIGMDDPGYEPVIMVRMAAASAVGRPSGSTAIICQDLVYYILTWTDILGSGHSMKSKINHARGNNKIEYLRQEVDVKNTKRILYAVQNRKIYGLNA